MKKINLLLSIIGLFLLVGCNLNKPLEFNDSLSFVAFDAKTGSTSEAKIVEKRKDKVGDAQQFYNDTILGVIKIPVTIAVPKTTGPITVNFDFDTVGIKVPAVENVDFKLVNASKTLTFPEGIGTQYIEIQTINDDVYRKDKTVNIVLKDNSAGLPFGNIKKYALTITDDDHPFGWMIGDYSGSGLELRTGQATWNMRIEGVSGDIYSFKVFGMASVGPYPMPMTSAYGVLAKYDEENSQLKIEIGQEFPTWNYGPSKLVAFKGPDGSIELKDGEKMACDIERDGTKVVIHVNDEYAFLITDGNNKGLYICAVVGDGDAVNTKWTKK